MKPILLALTLLAACNGSKVGGSATHDGSATQARCAQWTDASSCAADSGCVVNSCPDCNGNPSFIDCIGTGTPGAACPAQWLEGCCQLRASDTSCKALGGCYSVYGSTGQFAACYGGQPVCTMTQDCTSSISCPSGYSPTSGSNYPGGNPATDAGAGCGCVESSLCSPDLL